MLSCCEAYVVPDEECAVRTAEFVDQSDDYECPSVSRERTAFACTPPRKR